VNFLSVFADVNKQLADFNRPYTLHVIQMVNLCLEAHCTATCEGNRFQ